MPCTGTDMELLEEFDPFTPKRSLVTSFCPDAEREFQTGHCSRITTSLRPSSDNTATVIICVIFLKSRYVY